VTDVYNIFDGELDEEREDGFERLPNQRTALIHRRPRC